MNVKTVAFIFYPAVLIQFSLVQASASKSKPPEIRYQPLHDEIMFIDKIFIPCEARGEIHHKNTLLHTYWWERNGTKFETDMKFDVPKGSSRKMYGSFMTDAGKYQCFVKKNGSTAMSNEVSLRKIIIPKNLADEGKAVSKTVPLGSMYNFNCSWSGIPDYVGPFEQSHWIRSTPEGDIPMRDSLRITNNLRRSLFFSEVESADNGSYKYIFKIDENAYPICEVNLTVDGSTIDDRDKNGAQVTLQYQSNATETAVWKETKKLFCIYSRKSEITWEKNNTVLNNGTKYDIPKSQNYLTIKNFIVEDEGTYTCRVPSANGGSPIKHDFNVMIGKPFLTKRPENKEIIIGQTAEFHCQAPKAKRGEIQWFYNAKPIDKCEFYQDLYYSNTVLTIKNATNKHTGNYGCMFNNSNGTAYAEAYLYVNKEEFKIHDASVVNTTIQINETGILEWECPVTAFPSPTIKWTKNDAEFSDNTEDWRVVISNDGKSLTIQNFTCQDEGRYACSVYVNGKHYPSYFWINATVNSSECAWNQPPPEESESDITIIPYLIGFLVLVAIIAAILIVFKKHGYARSIVYDLRKREREAANPQHHRTEDRCDVSLLAGDPARSATLNLRRQNTENGITIAQAASHA